MIVARFLTASILVSIIFFFLNTINNKEVSCQMNFCLKFITSFCTAMQNLSFTFAKSTNVLKKKIALMVTLKTLTVSVTVMALSYYIFQIHILRLFSDIYGNGCDCFAFSPLIFNKASTLYSEKSKIAYEYGISRFRFHFVQIKRRKCEMVASGFHGNTFLFKY